MSDWSQWQTVSLVALVGWLILVASGYASYRVGARKTVTMALIWLAIFLGGFVLVSLFL
jgi:hypothetical protein